MRKEPEFKDQFAANFSDWGKAIVLYAEAMKSPPSGVKHALRSCDDESKWYLGVITFVLSVLVVSMSYAAIHALSQI